MKTITISLSDSDNETVEAEYFQFEDGWVTFKTMDHKAVVAYPEKRVTRIKSEDKASTFTIDLSNIASAEDVEQIVKSAMAHTYFTLRNS